MTDTSWAISHHNVSQPPEASWFTAGRFAVLLGLLIMVAFPDIISGAKTFYFRDFGLFGYPNAFYQKQCFWRGEIPLWNPLNNCGQPFLAQWNTLVLYPGALFYLLLPLSWSLAVFCLLHQWWAGLGMFFLARRWTGSAWAASVAGIVFAFNGMTLNSLMGPGHIATLGWMPWVVFWVERAWCEGGKTRVWAIMAGSLQMLAGGPEIVVLTWVILGLLALGELLPTRETWFGLDWFKSAHTLIMRFLLILALISGLTAVQWLPFLDLVVHSDRNLGLNGSAWPMPGTGWANLLVPLFHCFAGPQGVFLQHGQLFTASYYVGTATLLLSAIGLWHSPSRRLVLLALASLGSLVLALGNQSFFYGWLASVFPGLGLARYPVKFVWLPMLTLPLMAACGLRFFSTCAYGVRFSPRRNLWLGAALLLFAMGGVIWFEWKYPFPGDDWTAIWKNALARAGFLAAIVVALSRLGYTRNELPRARTLVSLAVLFLVWSDLMTQVPWQNPSIERALLDSGFLKLAPHPDAGQSRAMVSREASHIIQHTMVADGPKQYLGFRLALVDNCNLHDNIAMVDGVYALYLREFSAIRLLVYENTNAPMAGFTDFLGVSQVTAAGKQADWEFRPSFLPLVTAGQQPVFSSDRETLQALSKPDFNATNVVFLPQRAQAQITCREKAAVHISAYRFTSHRLAMEVDAQGAAMVVIAQAFYHNWRAYVDGRRVPLWCANHAFQAVEVPSGRHEIQLRYEDWGFYVGAILLGSTLAGCGMGLGLSRRRSHRLKCL